MHKKKTFVFALVGFFLVIFCVLAGIVYRFGKSEKVSSVCSGSHAYTIYKVSIRNDKIEPSHIEGHLCDKLEIKNYDDKFRVIAFGGHEDHVAYDGVLERTLKTNGKFEITLDKTGNFAFHDHLDEKVGATFNVSLRAEE